MPAPRLTSRRVTRPAQPRWGLAVLAVVAMVLLGVGSGIWLQAGIGPQTPLPQLLSLQMVPWLLGVGAVGAVLRVGAAWWPLLLDAGRGLLLLTALLALGQFGLSWWESGQVLAAPQFPLTNLFEVNIFLLALLVLGGLALERHQQQTAWGVGVAWMVGALLLLLGWLYGADQAGPRHIVPALKSYWLPIHVSVTMLSYAAFTLAATVVAVGLWQFYRHPTGAGAKAMLAVAEVWAFRAISFGFPLLTLGIILGALWAYEAWGGYWSWDPKETWALITWLIYAAYLHVRLYRRPGPVALAWWVLGGFVVMLFCFLGVNIFLSGLHSYGGLI